MNNPLMTRKGNSRRSAKKKEARNKAKTSKRKDERDPVSIGKDGKNWAGKKQAARIFSGPKTKNVTERY